MTPARSQRGAALVIALVIVAIATIVAATLVWENHLDRRRTANQLFGSEALANALGVEDFLRAVLAEDDLKSDTLQEPWARQGDVFPIEGGYLQGAVIDLQGRFNVNNLVDANGDPAQKQVKIFRALLGRLGLDEQLVDATVDWIDPDLEPQPNSLGGAEDDLYLRSDPPYRAANRSLTDISELRLVRGMTPEQFAVLAPYVTALPPLPATPGAGTASTATPININTAPPELIVAAAEAGQQPNQAGLTPELAAQLVELRNQEGFSDLEIANQVVAPYELDPEVFDVKSSYFRLHVLALIGASRVNLYSVLQRDPATGSVRTLSRTLGTP